MFIPGFQPAVYHVYVHQPLHLFWLALITVSLFSCGPNGENLMSIITLRDRSVLI